MDDQDHGGGGRGLGVLVRMKPQELADLDAWRLRQGDQPSRPEALRRLSKLALEAVKLVKLARQP